MELLFIRHAQPEWSRDGMAVDDPPLTALGAEQAKRLAERFESLEADELLVSPLVRAQQTAQPVAEALGLPIVTEAWLSEIGAPAWHGTPTEQVERVFREIRSRSVEELWEGIPGGESFSRFHERITAGVQGFLTDRGARQARDAPPQWHLDRDDRRIVVVAHAGTNATAIGHLLGIPPVPWEWERFPTFHASVSTLQPIVLSGANTFGLSRLSDVGHLPEDQHAVASPAMPSDELENINTLLRASPQTIDTPLADQRAAIDLLGAMAPLPDDVAVTAVDAGGVPAEQLDPAEAVAGRTLLYLHGGGYNIGSLASHRGVVARLAKAARARAYLVDYRLAPEHHFPAAIDDCLTAYRWVLGQVDPAQLVVLGESAGGGLTLALLAAARDEQVGLPRSAVVVSPWTDLTGSGGSMTSEGENDALLSKPMLEWWAENYASGDLTNPLASPHFADLTGFPPLLAIAASHELLRDDTVRLKEKAEAAGLDITVELYDDAIHAWTLFAGLVPEGDAAVARIGDYVDAQFG